MNYEVGQVWERDGKQREIVRLLTLGAGDYEEVQSIKAGSASLRYVHWKRPPVGVNRACWVSTWLDWVAKATLVPAGARP